MELLIPFRTVIQVVAVVAKELVALFQCLGSLHAENAAEAGVSKVRKFSVRQERVVNFVGETGAVVFEVPVFERNVQDLFLLLV